MTLLKQNDHSLTTMLKAWQASSNGIDDVAFGRVIDACYKQLRQMAAQRVRANSAVSVSPTELLHDAIICIGESDAVIKNSKHFLATMSLKMRTLLVDHARGGLADKRGNGALRMTFTESQLPMSDLSYELVAIDDALTQLDVTEPRSAQVMHLTYFAGMPREEIAKLLEISMPTVDRELRFGRAYTIEKIRAAK
jgi:RNA polymerase sigma factor (TIGR02999 family)